MGSEAGQPAALSPKVRPGRRWYLAAAAALLAGAAWLVVGLLSVGSQVDGFARVPLPAGGQVTLAHSGSYLIYFEANGADSRAVLPTFGVRVTPAAAPAVITSLKPYTGAITYNFGGHQGRAVLALQVAHAGRFLVQPVRVAALAGPGDLAIGPSLSGGVLFALLPGSPLIFAGVAGAVAVCIIRGRRLRALR